MKKDFSNALKPIVVNAISASVVERHVLLWPIEAIYLRPEFTIENANEDPALRESFYDTAIEITKTLPLPVKSFEYYRNNFVPDVLRSDVTNKEELIEYFDFERLKPRRHDSRFQMGFRSIHFIMRLNLDQIDTEYIAAIHKKLSSFYKVYAHPDFLIWGYGA